MTKPIVKWVGGKRQLIPHLIQNMPNFESLISGEARYFEPFVGGGALFFTMVDSGVENLTINDFNPELINLYKVVRDCPSNILLSMERNEMENSPLRFEEIRRWDRSDGWPHDRSDVDRAARFIYLNRTAFNGLWRVNSLGHFNAPFARYRNPGFPTMEVLLDASKALDKANILNGDFEDACKDAKAGDVVYFDPPYFPLNSSSSFVGYTKSGFDVEMQVRLAKLCDELTERGVNWMLSNSSAQESIDLYGSLKNAKLMVIKANRAVNSVGTKRGPVDEILVINQIK